MAAGCTIAGLEVIHANRKGQLAIIGSESHTPAEQFYALATYGTATGKGSLRRHLQFATEPHTETLSLLYGSLARHRRKPFERLEIRFDHDSRMLSPTRRAGFLFGLANQPRRNGVARPELDDEAAISEVRPHRRVIFILSGLPMRRNPRAIDLDRILAGFNRSGVWLGTHRKIAG